MRNGDQVYEKVPAFEGESLLETLTRMRVRGFESNLCNGYDTTYRPHVRPHDPFSDGPQCGMCRVVLEDNWYNRVDKETDGMAEQERHMLAEYTTDLQANTRLACCIPIEPWMDGMTLSVDPEPTAGGLSEIF